MRYVVCAVLVGLSVSACSSGSDTAESVTSSPGRPRSTYAPATQDPEEWERVPAKDRDAFLAVLERADPGLVDGDNQQKRGLRRAVYTCREIDKGLSGDKLAIYVSQRFTGGHGSVSIAEGRRIGAAVQVWICPSLK